MECYRKARDVFNHFREQVRTHFRAAKNRIPESRAQLEKLCQQPIPIPIGGEVLKDFLDAVAAAGLLKQEKEEHCYRPAVRASKDEVERLANILDGSWLELYVASLLHEGAQRWADPHWSVRIRKLDTIPIGETDVVAFDILKCALHIISCKTRVQGPLETLEALTQRRRDLGGLYAKATLVLLESRKG